MVGFNMFWQKKAAASLTEFGLLIGLISVLLLTSLSSLGTSISSLFGTVETNLNGVTTTQPFLLISGDLSVSLLSNSVTKNFTAKNIASISDIHVQSSTPSILPNSAIQITSLTPPTLSIDVSQALTAGTTNILLSAGESTSQISLSLTHPQTCLDIANEGILTTGAYILDPDGLSGPIEPINLWCVMDSTSMQAAGYAYSGWTALAHDRQTLSTDVDCEGSDCKVFDVTYYDEDGGIIPNETIFALMDLSTDIAQYFYKSCYASLISTEYATTDAAVNLVKLGSTTKVPLSRTQHFGVSSLACDNNDTTWRSDSTTFINKTDILPIASLWGGDSGNANEIGQYRFGRFYMR